MSVNKSRYSIEDGLSIYDISENGRRLRDYILPEFDKFVQRLFQRATNMPIIQDYRSRECVQEFAMIPENIISFKMEQKKHFLGSENDVQEICANRVEFVSQM